MDLKAPPFWSTKLLDELTNLEWESLCDGCGRCCLHKLEDIDTGLYFYTNVACRLLDTETCRCTNYLQRNTLVEDCVQLSPCDDDPYQWLPVSCAYRRVAEGKGLEWWHPLVSGNPETVHQAGISVRNRTVSEITVIEDSIEDHIISWIDF
jgi:uncharacterized cysteine cluster protein YcgN (CxxCxxCC family)